MSPAERAPAARWTSLPPWKSASVGIERMRNRSPSSGTASVFTFKTSHSPAAAFATLSSSGAIIRHGPHQGAQKSTTTGSDDEPTAASKVVASDTSTGSAGAVNAARQLPQRVTWPSVPKRRRLVLPHDAHGTRTPCWSSLEVDMLTTKTPFSQWACPNPEPRTPNPEPEPRTPNPEQRT